MKRRTCCGMAALLLLLMITSGVRAQPCDPVIQAQSIDNWALQYRERGNRCEGFYAAVMVSHWETVGMMLGKFDFALDETGVIEVSSSIVTDQPVHVRATGIPLKTYYRMDAQLQPGETLFWPVADVLYAQQLSASKVGIFGWIGTENDKVYVPVAISSKSGSGERHAVIRFLSSPPVDVENVRWRMSDVLDAACVGFGDWRTAEKEFYQHGEPIVIILPESEARELCVEVTAQSKQTNQWERYVSRIIVRQ